MSEWIEWNGGECPVPGDTVVEYKTRLGRTNHTNEARYVHWNHDFYRPAIAAYRIVESVWNSDTLTPTDAPKTLHDEYVMAGVIGLVMRKGVDISNLEIESLFDLADRCVKERKP